MTVFAELSLIIVIATFFAMVMRLLKQPLVIAYIIAGIVSGPLLLDIIHSEETLELFSKMGITILLFIIGLHLNPKIIKEVGGVSLVTGLGQIIFTSLIGFVLSLVLGFNPIQALFIGIALTFSSTIIILKLLQDKGDLEDLYGKIAVGFLLIQDIAASVILLTVTVLTQSGTADLFSFLSATSLKIIGLVTVLYLISRFILPKVTYFAAKSQETLFLFCIAWGMSVGSLFVMSGLSVEIGALIAGVALSTTTYAAEISSRLRPLRDFFVVVFFILLGSGMVIENLVAILIPAIILSLFVLIGNPLIVFILMTQLGYHKRTSFFAGLTVAQISEFSLILIALGVSTGVVGDEVSSLVTIVGLITIAVSSYMIIYSNNLYSFVNPFLSKLSFKKVTRTSADLKHAEYDMILFGYGRVGLDYIKAFQKLKKKFLVVDFSPQAIDKLEELSVEHLYGDAEDVEFMSEMPLDKVKMVVSTIADFETDLIISRQTRSRNENAIIIVKSNNIHEAQELYANGASYVVMPHYLGARYASRMIKRLGTSRTKYKKAREDHLKFLLEKSV